MPACRVQELAASLGPKARDAQLPAFDARLVEPPPVPNVEEPDEDFPRLSTPVPPPRRNQPLVRRPAAPTITNEGTGGMPGTGTLRPPGAVPPPPRTIPKSMLKELEDWDGAGVDSLPPTTAAPDSRQPSRPAHATPLGRSETAPETHGEGSTSAPDPSAPNGPSQSPEPSTPADVPEPELSAPAHAPPEDGRIPYDPDTAPARFPQWLRPVREVRQSTILALSAAAASLVTGAWLVLRTPVVQRATPTPNASSTRAPEPVAACRIERVAQRVSPRIFMPVAPIAFEGAMASDVAIGFAETPTTAAGITVDPNALSVQFPFREAQTKKIVSVTPLHGGSQTSFVTVREGIELQQARALPGTAYTLFGVTAQGLARQSAGQPPENVWPLESATAITDPRLAWAIGLGHAITFRQGGQSGTIQLAYLTESGHSLVAPVAVPTDATMLGTPSIGLFMPSRTDDAARRDERESGPSPSAVTPTDAGSLQGTRVFLTFAGRKSENEPWSIYSTTAAWGQAPSETRVFALPEGGPGGDAISPSVASLMDGNWLLQWSEGQSGQRQVRVQLLDAALRPIGKAHTVSPPNSNSGQGLLWTRGSRAVSFFVVSTGKLAELWASSLTCSK
ncbi:MAG: hypothetical protein QM784_24785 [Polyangiaceae bacterium]